MTATQYIILVACVLLAAFLLWKEIQRQNKLRLALRIIASLLAVACLIFFAIPVYINATENNKNKEAVLLTEGFNRDSLKHFLQNHKSIPVYTPGKYEALQPNDIEILHVFGYGLMKEEWQTLKPPYINIHTPPIINGITAVAYNKKMNTGETLMVQGKYSNTINKPVKLILGGFGIVFDSMIIEAAKTQQFELKATPKFIGKAVYHLSAITNKDTIEHEPVPIEVSAATPLKILLLAAYPDFENKFLQNWLAGNNYVVASRTTISKNKYSYLYIDTGKFSLERITPTMPEQFDVLVADAAELLSLSKQELFNIKTSIIEKGLGLIIKADSTSKPTFFYSNNCTIIPAVHNSKQVLTIQLPGNDTASSLPVENTFFIQAKDGVQRLITDSKQNVLACNALYGEGNIVFSTFKNSFYWMLSGDKKSYDVLWSLLIEKAARKKQLNEQWRYSPAFPKVNKTVLLTAETQSAAPIQITAENNFITFAAQPFVPFEWQGIYRPRNAGWQSISSANNEPGWLYIFNKNDWKNFEAFQKINDTYAYADESIKRLNKSVKNNLNKKTIPAFYFFILFFCCCIFLWIERKLS